MWPASSYLQRYSTKYTYLHRYRCLEVRKVIDTIEIIMISADYIMGSPSYLTTFMIMNYMPRALWYNLWLYFTTEKAIDDK